MAGLAIGLFTGGTVIGGILAFGLMATSSCAVSVALRHTNEALNEATGTAGLRDKEESQLAPVPTRDKLRVDSQSLDNAMERTWVERTRDQKNTSMLGTRNSASHLR
jgi:hypothetical protein